MALVLLNPIEDPNSFDVVTIAGRTSPGLAQVQSISRSYSWDVKVGKGAFGSTTTFTGRVPAEFSVLFTLWKRAHFAAWELFCDRLKYNPAKIRYNVETRWVSGVDAVDIFHPSLAQLDINSVVVKKINGLTHKGKGVWNTSIEFLEWYPPPKLSVVATPVGSTPVDGLPPNPAITQRNAQLAALQAQAKKAGI
jgi:hypothetical protein